MNKTWNINSPEEMIALGKQFGTYAKPNMIMALEGDLGAGKTVFTKGIALGLGISQMVNSPTFTIMKVYEGGRLTLYHMDWYRITNDSGDEDLEEFLYADGLSVIEWASMADGILPKRCLHIQVKNTCDANKRIVSCETNDPLYSDLLKEIQ